MRLFVSLRPPPVAIEHLRAQRPQWPTDPARWHVTLAFLGDDAQPAPVHRSLSARLAGRPRLDLRLEGSGSFGRGPLWIGVGGDLTGLHELAAVVAAAAREAGVTLVDRPYRPHLTVGRRVPDMPGYRGPQWRATEVELVRSDLRPRVVHAVLERYPLA